MIDKVLVVDDSRTSRLFIIQALEMAGLKDCAFVEASNGIDALQQLKTDSAIKWLVTDINMPVKCGMSMIRDIREQNFCPQLNVIVISSTQNLHRDAELKGLGVLAILPKPIQMPKLIEAIAKVKGAP